MQRLWSQSERRVARDRQRCAGAAAAQQPGRAEKAGRPHPQPERRAAPDAFWRLAARQPRPAAKCVIDASVAAKWLAPEPDSALAEALLDDDLIVPDLLYAEVGNILWKKQMRGEMEATTARVGARWLLQVPMRVHDSASLLADTLALALQLQHPAYDCFYLVLARQADVQLITADRRFHARCHASDVAGLGQWVRMPDA